MARSGMLVLATLLVPMLSACGPEGWQSEVAFTAPDKLGGCAIGDLDPSRPGNEIATVCSNGEVYLVYREGGGWKNERIAKVGGEMIQCAIGDADPTREGNELVVVGMQSGGEADGGPGAAHLVFKEGGSWKQELLFEDVALLHGVCVADLDPGKPGHEILVVGFSKHATLISREGKMWKGEKVADLGSAGKTAVGYKAGAAVVCSGGTIMSVLLTRKGWRSRVMDRADAGQSRVATDGQRILAARDDGSLGLVDSEGRTDIYKEPQKLRGAVLADLDPGKPGIEAATAGYGGTITVLYPENGKWRPVTVAKDTGKFHHLAAGELLKAGKGLELAGCGYSKRLTVVFRGG